MQTTHSVFSQELRKTSRKRRRKRTKRGRGVELKLQLTDLQHLRRPDPISLTKVQGSKQRQSRVLSNSDHTLRKVGDLNHLKPISTLSINLWVFQIVCLFASSPLLLGSKNSLVDQDGNKYLQQHNPLIWDYPNDLLPSDRLLGLFLIDHLYLQTLK